ncbi:MAG TPA: DUF4825 domain-containing protein [Bacilli bacterium]|nr:DUF4825 domain-containing protein [Bacilli bacterium]
MKKLNSYFPIWLLMVMPPLVVLTIVYNFITAALGLLIFLFLINTKNIFDFYSKNVLKIWGLSLGLDVITFALLFLPELLYKNSFFTKNLIEPLETNPYTNILSFIYVVFVIAINILVAYLMLKKIFKNIETKKLNIKVFVIIIFIIPYIFFVPSNKIIKTKYVSLNDYKGTVMKDKSNVSGLLKHLETTKYISSYIIDTHTEPYTLKLYLKEINDNYVLMFEKDASILLNLVEDVNEIVFHMNGTSYTYKVNDINEIFTNIKKISIDDISNRYKDSKFEDYTYLGRVSSYDAFDTSDYCKLDKQLLFSTADEDYYLSCTKVEEILLFKDKTKVNIKEALDSNLITQDDVLSSSLKISSEKKNS